MKYLLLLLLSLPSLATVELVNGSVSDYHFKRLTKVAYVLNHAFSNPSFKREIKEIDPALVNHVEGYTRMVVRGDTFLTNQIAFYDGDLIISSDMIGQMSAFQASTICHELAHSWGYEHDSKVIDYYDSVPVLFGDACRYYYMKNVRDWR